MRQNFLLILATGFFAGANPSSAAELGLFDNAQDIGMVSRAGSTKWDGTSFTVAGGGENMWFTNDAFHFASKKVSGDFSLSSALKFLSAGGNAHRKACLLIRQSLRPDSAYVDVAIHGDGLTSLQYRATDGGPTREVQLSVKGPELVRLERQSNSVFVSLPAEDGKFAPSGASVRIQLDDPVYAGIGVCAHDDKDLQQAQFSQVKLERKITKDSKPVLHCSLETVAIASKDRRLVYHTTNHMEAPNWSRDGKTLLFNAGGHLYTLAVAGGTPAQVDTSFAVRCNNDHGFSPDGKLLAISDQTKERKSLIYLVPSAGGEPRSITKLAPSYWHGWSPDGSTLVYCAERNGEFDVYSIPAAGGEEKRLTTAKGLDDGPDYSADGKYIYFNSDRTGTMEIWRMKPDGTEQAPVIADEFNNWFPHPSPDGKWIVFLSYEKTVAGHPENQPVKLRLMPLAGGVIQDLASLFGGQGTINVPSWSPDSKNVAFVSYELIYPSVP